MVDYLKSVLHFMSVVFSTIALVSKSSFMNNKMKKSGIDCKAVKVSSLPLEQKPYFSHNFAMSSNLSQIEAV